MCFGNRANEEICDQARRMRTMCEASGHVPQQAIRHVRALSSLARTEIAVTVVVGKRQTICLVVHRGDWGLGVSRAPAIPRTDPKVCIVWGEITW